MKTSPNGKALNMTAAPIPERFSLSDTLFRRTRRQTLVCELQRGFQGHEGKENTDVSAREVSRFRWCAKTEGGEATVTVYQTRSSDSA